MDFIGPPFFETPMNLSQLANNGIDFMGSFPVSYRNSYILLVVDYVSRRVEAKATKTNDAKVKVEQILDCFNLLGQRVVRFITLEFGDYALVWWMQVLEDVRRGKTDSCEDWVALKHLISHRFVPPSYSRDLHKKLQRLYQGSRSVEEYHKEMEMNLMRAQIIESEEATLA
ncbi:hypothetical protein CR513_00502, partial [Mucuna pruriens]